ncbi:TPA: hypothetical protein ACOTGN_000685 [Clostridium perfringens]|uniref:hypothetical protein n=1 Tax=Clostridium perfringens TaxID=1502 RepID=UPI0023F90A3B|nr:hypothetical protein [Clostridium perfringens]EJT6612799.1 hypothetical protein [Clostridium perfringens]MDM0799417.1 hypothetical protein [Clostridium perfringens]MDM0826350.1 hypothetical protein [Clostridium perfringens]MDM0866530.1 hypothetical protein [Clostridium perfringens]MDU0865972.1 hypothetical protein [Clostridium perfringens]
MKKIITKGFVNKETGEFFDVSELIEVKESNDVKNSFKSIQNTNDYINDNLGYYFHLLYGDILKLDLEPQMLVRFLYLCSYMNYQYTLVSGNTKAQKKISESELQDILKLNKTTFFETKKYLLDNNLIIIEDNKIKIDDKFVKKGKGVLKGDLINMEVTRIFNNGIQDLYNGVKPIQHKKLETFIRILPFINIKYNIICENPLETDIEKVKPLKWTELGRLIGLSPATSKRLRSELWSLKVNDSVAIGEFSTFLCGKSIVINPSVYYKGNNIDDLAGIVNMFKVRR